MQILKAVVDEMPVDCADCPMLGVTKREGDTPSMILCSLMNREITNTTGEQPEWCPLEEKGE